MIDIALTLLYGRDYIKFMLCSNMLCQDVIKFVICYVMLCQYTVKFMWRLCNDKSWTSSLNNSANKTIIEYSDDATISSSLSQN